MSKCKCCTCGYVWEKGQSGSHSCSKYLLDRIGILEHTMHVVIRRHAEWDNGIIRPLAEQTHAIADAIRVLERLK